MISQTAKKCSVCQRGYPLSAVFCPYDGHNLDETTGEQPVVGPHTPGYDEPLAPDYDPLIGHTIDKRYRIVSNIGHGGMGTVYRAVHTELNRPCAIKVIRAELGSDRIAIRRFRREAVVLGSLS